jgi:hypothetical protein
MKKIIFAKTMIIKDNWFSKIFYNIFYCFLSLSKREATALFIREYVIHDGIWFQAAIAGSVFISSLHRPMARNGIR